MTRCEPCPICNGTGKVHRGFYNRQGGNELTTSSCATEQCRTCHGTGIVWAKDEPSPEEKIIEIGEQE